MPWLKILVARRRLLDIDIGIDALNMHISNADVARDGCRTFWASLPTGLLSRITIALSMAPVRRRLLDIDIVIDALNMHIGNADVARDGCRTFWASLPTGLLSRITIDYRVLLLRCRWLQLH